MAAQKTHTKTPLIYSSKLSELNNADVFLKLETFQPSYSFKYRGVSLFIARAQADAELKSGKIHPVIASSGNAGLAATIASRAYGLPCTVFLPETAVKSTIELLRRHGATVVTHGRFYAEALTKAKGMVASDPATYVMVPSYEHPTLWEGHSSIIHEIKEQLSSQFGIDRHPDAVACSVGGGGLLGGVLVGCKNVGWNDVTIAAVETNGSDCFYHSMSLNGNRFNSHPDSHPKFLSQNPHIKITHKDGSNIALAHLTRFNSLASGSLGASEPSDSVVRMALERDGGDGRVKTVSVPDEMAIDALLKFTDDHKLLVEIACATTLTLAYNPALFSKIVEAKAGSQTLDGRPVVVLVLCGGFKIDLNTIEEYRSFAKDKVEEGSLEGNEGSWSVKYDDGTTLKVTRTWST